MQNYVDRTTKLFKRLRGDMVANDLTNIDIAKEINRTPNHVSHCFNDKAQFLLSEQYQIMHMIHRPIEDLYLIFPEGGKDVYRVNERCTSNEQVGC